MRPTRLTIFNHLWAVAGFCEWARWSYTETGFSWALLAASWLLFSFPNSTITLAVYALTQIFFTLFASNAPWNHGLFMAMINVTILATIARASFERGRLVAAVPIDTEQNRDDHELLTETFAPPVRAGLVVLYLFTFFHKLNADFINPEVSCAGFILGRINTTYHILPTGQWAVIASIWATLLAELLIPLLLLRRQTVFLALVTGVGFHMLLSQHGALFGFAAMIFAIYFLFLPKTFTVEVARSFDLLVDRLPLRSLRPVALPLLSTLIIIAVGTIGEKFEIDHLTRAKVPWDFWLLAVAACFAPAFATLFRSRPENSMRPRWAALTLLPLLVFANGLPPYLGLKTETSWSMYSNLRTEVRNNHFLVPAGIKLFGFQDDLVEIIDTSSADFQYYVGTDVRMPVFEFRRMCSKLAPDAFVRFRYNGRETVVQGGQADGTIGDLCTPPPRILADTLRFRPVDIGPHVTCRH